MSKRRRVKAARSSSAAPEQLISPASLSQLTRIPVEELRRLSGKNYFRRLKGGYPLEEAIKGCFLARAEEAESANGLPVFQSIAQAANRTGIPVAVFKQEKKLGSDAFQYSRVNLGKFLRGLFSRDGESENWGDYFNKFRAMREKIRWQEDAHKSLPADEVFFAINRAKSALFSQLDRFFKLELPPALKGMSEQQIEERLAESALKLKEEYSNEIKKLIASRTLRVRSDELEDIEASLVSAAER